MSSTPFQVHAKHGYKNFARNVSVGNLRLKINCLFDLGRFVGKKTAGRSTQLSPGKECFLEDLLQQVEAICLFSDVTPLKSRGLQLQASLNYFLVCFA